MKRRRWYVTTIRVYRLIHACKNLMKSGRIIIKGEWKGFFVSVYHFAYQSFSLSLCHSSKISPRIELFNKNEVWILPRLLLLMYLGVKSWYDEDMIQYNKYKTDMVPFFIQTEIVGTARFRRRGDFTCLIIYYTNQNIYLIIHRRICQSALLL